MLMLIIPRVLGAIYYCPRVFSSPELKAQVSFSDHLLSVCLSVCKLSHFILFSRTTGLISTKLNTKHPWVKGIQVYSCEEPYLFAREIHSKKSKKTLTLKIFKITEQLSQYRPNLA